MEYLGRVCCCCCCCCCWLCWRGCSFCCDCRRCCGCGWRMNRWESTAFDEVGLSIGKLRQHQTTGHSCRSFSWCREGDGKCSLLEDWCGSKSSATTRATFVTRWVYPPKKVWPVMPKRYSGLKLPLAIGGCSFVSIVVCVGCC